MNHNIGKIRLSIVSHNQDELVHRLLQSISCHCNTKDIAATVVRNTKTVSGEFDQRTYGFPVTTIQNRHRKGFGTNHNQAFTTCVEEFFCVLNPDILIQSDIFAELRGHFSDAALGVVAPALYDSNRQVQDNARTFPTPGRIIQKAFAGKRHAHTDFDSGQFCYPDWIAGMFMMLPARVFKEIKGFDEHYFMYYEDVDLCMRLRRAGYEVKLVYNVNAIHDAQRSSHRSLRHLSWHISSMLRFFRQYPHIT